LGRVPIKIGGRTLKPAERSAVGVHDIILRAIRQNFGRRATIMQTGEERTESLGFSTGFRNRQPTTQFGQHKRFRPRPWNEINHMLQVIRRHGDHNASIVNVIRNHTTTHVPSHINPIRHKGGGSQRSNRNPSASLTSRTHKVFCVR
jgi:hypothetical protein